MTPAAPPQQTVPPAAPAARRGSVQLTPALLAAVATAATLGAHIGLRPFTWTHEWLLTTWQYGFSIVMLGPLISGFSAWSAAAMSRGARPVVDSAGRSLAVLARTAAETLRWSLAVFALGYLALLATTWIVSSPGAAGWRDVLPVVASFAALVFFSAVGTAVGWRLPFVATAPLLALVTFTLGVLAYGTRLSFVIDVGGASSSLVGLAANTSRVALQVLFFAAGTGAALLLGASPDPFGGARHRFERYGAAAAAGALLIAGAVDDPPRLVVDLATPVVCGRASPSSPVVCLGPGYRDTVLPISQALSGPVARAVAAGAAIPNRFDQRQGTAGAAVVDPDLLSQGPDAPAQYVANSLFPRDCDVMASTGLFTAFTAMAWWLAPDDARPLIASSAQLPDALAGSPDEQLAWARDAVHQLRACSAS